MSRLLHWEFDGNPKLRLPKNLLRRCVKACVHACLYARAYAFALLCARVRVLVQTNTPPPQGRLPLQTNRLRCGIKPSHLLLKSGCNSVGLCGAGAAAGAGGPHEEVPQDYSGGVASRHMSHVTRHTSHVTRHTSNVTRHTSHFTRHTSHVTRHTSHVTPPQVCEEVLWDDLGLEEVPKTIQDVPYVT